MQCKSFPFQFKKIAYRGSENVYEALAKVHSTLRNSGLGGRKE